MMKTDNYEDGPEATGSSRDGSGGLRDEAGDAVEQAGETTAAALTGGDTSAERPVGADTLVRVEGDPRPEDGQG
ncbi:MAG TPA: hypothetical protein VEY09_13045 [Pyrinomonadaceae bacterium]|nr:hypothetical protein [Pyrinomonadaceae bacterium]